MAEGAVRVGLAGNDEAHRILLQRLADDYTPDVPDLERRRTWVGDAAGRAFLNTGKRPPRRNAPSGRPEYRSQRHGAEPRGAASVFVEAVQQFAGRADITLVLMDEDGDTSRVGAAETATSIIARRGGPKAVLGVCNPCAEGWLVAMIGRARPARLQSLERALNTGLATHPERLTSTPPTSPRNAKRALHFLLDEEPDDPKRYPATTPEVAVTEPALSEAAGEGRKWVALRGCGLGPFFEELCSKYAPLVRT